MNKNHLSVILALALPAVCAHAQSTAPTPTPAASDLSVVLTPSFVSQYMFRGLRFGGPSFQPYVELRSDSFLFGVWSNFPLKDKVPGQSDPEFDFYGSCTIETIKDTLSFTPGCTIYTYPNANKKDGFYKAEYEPNLTASYTVAGLKLTPGLYYNFTLKGPTLELGAAYAVPLADLGTELDFSGTIGTYKWRAFDADTSPDVKIWGNYWLLGVAAPFQITKESKLTIGWAYTKSSNSFRKQGSAPKEPTEEAVGRGVVTVSYSHSF